MEEPGKERSEEIKKQMQVLIGEAEIQSNRARESRGKFEQLREKILATMNFEDPRQLEGFRIAMDNLYTYGHDAGEASETALALRQQLDLITKMNDDADRRNKINDAREVARDRSLAEAQERVAKSSERQADALEQLVALRRDSR